ncbi:MAG: FHA domain-containing protein, partial [Candidatus Micrarchaeota archaeon]|nr:FHA domain-containing protein [Candidatus Micrarchaeota archaeon]
MPKPSDAAKARVAQLKAATAQPPVQATSLTQGIGRPKSLSDILPSAPAHAAEAIVTTSAPQPSATVTEPLTLAREPTVMERIERAKRDKDFAFLVNTVILDEGKIYTKEEKLRTVEVLEELDETKSLNEALNKKLYGKSEDDVKAVITAIVNALIKIRARKTVEEIPKMIDSKEGWRLKQDVLDNGHISEQHKLAAIAGLEQLEDVFQLDLALRYNRGANSPNIVNAAKQAIPRIIKKLDSEKLFKIILHVDRSNTEFVYSLETRKLAVDKLVSLNTPEINKRLSKLVVAVGLEEVGEELGNYIKTKLEETKPQALPAAVYQHESVRKAVADRDFDTLFRIVVLKEDAIREEALEAITGLMDLGIAEKQYGDAEIAVNRLERILGSIATLSKRGHATEVITKTKNAIDNINLRNGYKTEDVERAKASGEAAELGNIILGKIKPRSREIALAAIEALKSLKPEVALTIFIEIRDHKKFQELHGEVPNKVRWAITDLEKLQTAKEPELAAGLVTPPVAPSATTSTSGTVEDQVAAMDWYEIRRIIVGYNPNSETKKAIIKRLEKDALTGLATGNFGILIRCTSELEGVARDNNVEKDGQEVITLAKEAYNRLERKHLEDGENRPQVLFMVLDNEILDLDTKKMAVDRIFELNDSAAMERLENEHSEPTFDQELATYVREKLDAIDSASDNLISVEETRGRAANDEERSWAEQIGEFPVVTAPGITGNTTELNLGDIGIEYPVDNANVGSSVVDPVNLVSDVELVKHVITNSFDVPKRLAAVAELAKRKNADALRTALEQLDVTPEFDASTTEVRAAIINAGIRLEVEEEHEAKLVTAMTGNETTAVEAVDNFFNDQREHELEIVAGEIKHETLTRESTAKRYATIKLLQLRASLHYEIIGTTTAKIDALISAAQTRYGSSDLVVLAGPNENLSSYVLIAAARYMAIDTTVDPGTKEGLENIRRLRRMLDSTPSEKELENVLLVATHCEIIQRGDSEMCDRSLDMLIERPPQNIDNSRIVNALSNRHSEKRSQDTPEFRNRLVLANRSVSMEENLYFASRRTEEIKTEIEKIIADGEVFFGSEITGREMERVVQNRLIDVTKKLTNIAIAQPSKAEDCFMGITSILTRAVGNEKLAFMAMDLVGSENGVIETILNTPGITPANRTLLNRQAIETATDMMQACRIVNLAEDRKSELISLSMRGFALAVSAAYPDQYEPRIAVYLNAFKNQRDAESVAFVAKKFNEFIGEKPDMEAFVGAESSKHGHRLDIVTAMIVAKKAEERMPGAGSVLVQERTHVTAPVNAPITLDVFDEHEGLVGSETFTGDEIIIGRKSTANIVITDKQVSKLHVKITRDSEGIWIYDLGSKNGTFVNGTKITGRTLLSDGDEIEVGHKKVKLHVPALAPATRLEERKDRSTRDRTDKDVEREVRTNADIARDIRTAMTSTSEDEVRMAIYRLEQYENEEALMAITGEAYQTEFTAPSLLRQEAISALDRLRERQTKNSHELAVTFIAEMVETDPELARRINNDPLTNQTFINLATTMAIRMNLRINNEDNLLTRREKTIAVADQLRVYKTDAKALLTAIVLEERIKIGSKEEVIEDCNLLANKPAIVAGYENSVLTAIRSRYPEKRDTDKELETALTDAGQILGVVVKLDQIKRSVEDEGRPYASELIELVTNIATSSNTERDKQRLEVILAVTTQTLAQIASRQPEKESICTEIIERITATKPIRPILTNEEAAHIFENLLQHRKKGEMIEEATKIAMNPREPAEMVKLAVNFVFENSELTVPGKGPDAIIEFLQNNDSELATELFRPIKTVKEIYDNRGYSVLTEAIREAGKGLGHAHNNIDKVLHNRILGGPITFERVRSILDYEIKYLGNPQNERTYWIANLATLEEVKKGYFNTRSIAEIAGAILNLNTVSTAKKAVKTLEKYYKSNKVSQKHKGRIAEAVRDAAK